jgi:hypothetical protein
MGGSWLYNVYSGGGAGNTIFRTAGGEYNWLSQTQQLMKLFSDGHLQTYGGISAAHVYVPVPDVTTAAPNISFLPDVGGQYTATGNYYEFHVYASKNGQFSVNPLIFSGTDSNDSNNFYMEFVWDDMGADFYRVVVISDPQFGAVGDYYFDTPYTTADIGQSTGVGYVETVGYYSAGNTVTPNIGIITPKFNVDGATGHITTNVTVDGNVTASALSIGGNATFAGNISAATLILPNGSTIDQGVGDRIRFTNNGSVGYSAFEYTDNDSISNQTSVTYGKSGVYGMQIYGYDTSWVGTNLETYFGVTYFSGTDMGGSWIYGVYSGGGVGNTVYKSAGGEYSWLSQTQQLMKLFGDGHLQTYGGIEVGDTGTLGTNNNANAVIDNLGIFKSVGNGIDTRINDNWGNVTGLYTNTSAVPNSIGVYATDNVGAVGAFCFQGSYGVYGFKGSSAMAGRFEDAANAVELCNGTNAISASGNVVVGGNVTAKGLSLGYSVQTVDYALTTDDYFILASGSAALTITLPDATTNAGKIYKVKNVSTYNVTLSGSQNIDNSNNLIINQWSAAEVISSGVSWFIV